MDNKTHKNDAEDPASKFEKKKKSGKWKCLIILLVSLTIVLLIGIISVMVAIIFQFQQVVDQETAMSYKTKSLTVLKSSNNGETIQQPTFNQVKGTTINNNEQPELTVSPKNATVKSSTVILDCKFNMKVNCYWLRDGQLVEIGERYSYISGNSESDDCSLKINSVTDFDYKSWQCGSHEYNVQSKPAVLTKNTIAIEFTNKPKDQAVALGGNIRFECQFDKPVICSWLRNNDPLSISERYFYVDKSTELRTDCSIDIVGVKSIDVGTWTCSGSLSKNSNYISTTVQLNQVYDNPKTFQSQQRKNELDVNMDLAADTSFIEEPQDKNGKIGESIKLACKFNKEVACAWLRDDNHVEIGGRYKFINGNDKKDCSIQITDLQLQDKARWSCSTLADSYSEGIKSREANVLII